MMNVNLRVTSLLATLVIFAFSDLSYAATIVVNSTTDSATAGDGLCTLREAISNSNSDSDSTAGDCSAGSGTDAVSFSIAGSGVQTITPTASFASITDPVNIDGTTQSGASCEPRNLLIEIDGSLLPDSMDNVLSISSGGDGSTIVGLVFNGAPNGGLAISADSVTVECSHFGTNAAGTAADPNMNEGVRINGSMNVIGGTSSGAFNVISGNSNQGFDVESGSNNQLLGNFIGTDVTGTAAIPNNDGGINIQAGTGNVIGGTTSGSRNIVSGNQGPGVLTSGGSGTLIFGNYVGTDITGASALPNTSQGIEIGAGSSGAIIGGTTVAHRNIVSGNQGFAMLISGTNAVVQGNIIGLNASGSGTLANGVIGILVLNSSGHQIGGTDTGQGNTISGNSSLGLLVSGQGGSSSNITIQGNFIGTDTNGDVTTGFGNSGGISLFGDVSNVIVGGTATGAGNTIAGNSAGGIAAVSIPGSTPIDNSILGNAIFSNTALGIDLSTDSEPNQVPDVEVGVTANDSGDADVGPNEFLNFPLLTRVEDAGEDEIKVDFTADLIAGSYRIEFFSNSQTNSFENGDGETFLAAVTITHLGTGAESFSHTFSSSTTSNIAATTTEDLGSGTFGSTSEFSNRLSPCTDLSDTIRIVTKRARKLRALTSDLFAIRERVVAVCTAQVAGSEQNRARRRRVNRLFSSISASIDMLPVEDEITCQVGTCSVFDTTSLKTRIERLLRRIAAINRRQIRITCIRNNALRQVRRNRSSISTTLTAALDALANYTSSPTVCTS